MKAAIHLGPNYLVNLEVYKKKNFEEIQSLSNITQKWTIDMDEIRINSRSSGSVDKKPKYVSTQIPFLLGTDE